MIKPVVLFAFREECPTCEEVRPLIEKYASEHPEKQVYEILSSPELKDKLGIKETIDLPLIAVFERGMQSTKASTGKIEYDALVLFVEDARRNMESKGGCQPKGECPHEKRVKELEQEVAWLKSQNEKLIDKLTK